MANFCSKCGSQLPERGKFCPHCGQPAAAAPMPQSDSVPAQPDQPQNQNWQQPQSQSWQQTQKQGWQQPQNQGWQQTDASVSAAPGKKSKAGLIVGLVSLFLVGLAALACFVWPGFVKKGSSDSDATNTTVSAPALASKPTTPAPSAETEPTATATQPTEPTVTEPVTEPATTEPVTTEPVTTEPVVTEPVNPFRDVVEDDPCYEEYLWAHSHGVLTGDLLAGDTVLSRGDTLLMLWKAFGAPAAAAADMPFQDVTVSDECFPAVLWAVGAKLISVPEDKAFNPNGEMTRDQAAAILCNAVGGDGSGCPKAYLDVGSKKYYYNAVNWGCAAGVFERYYDFSFYPTDPLYRGDYACWLARAMEPTLALDPTVPEGDDFDYYGIEINLKPHGVAYFNAQPKGEDAVTKRLKVTVESYEVFTEAENYTAKDGYEWRKGVFLIGFGDADANSYGYSLYANLCDSNYVDLYLMEHASNDDGTNSSWIIYNGVPYKITMSPLIAEEVEGALYRVTYAVHVPVGYDGMVVRFNSVENETRYFYEKYDDLADFVIFRFD